MLYLMPRIVRLTSPNLNYVIVLGVILMYISVYLYCLSMDNTAIQLVVAKVRHNI